MELREIFAIIRKRMWIIILLIIVSVLTSFILSSVVMDKIYSSNAILVVVKERTDQTSIEYNDILLNQRLVNTYTQVIKSRSVLQTVIDELHLDVNVDELSDNISVQKT